MRARLRRMHRLGRGGLSASLVAAAVPARRHRPARRRPTPSSSRSLTQIKAGPRTIMPLPSRPSAQAAIRFCAAAGGETAGRCTTRCGKHAGVRPRRRARQERQGARLLRGEFPAGANLKAWRDHRPADRLLRADCRWLALSESGILRAALPAPARSGVEGQKKAFTGSFPNRAKVGKLNAKKRVRALSRPTRHRTRCARRAAAGDRWIREPGRR